MPSRKLKNAEQDKNVECEDVFLPPIRDTSAKGMNKKANAYHAVKMREFFENNPLANHFEDYVAQSNMTYKEFDAAMSRDKDFRDAVERLKPLLYSKIKTGYQQGEIKSHIPAQHLHQYSPWYRASIKELASLSAESELPYKKDFEKYKNDLDKTTLQMASDLKLFDATTEDALKRFKLKE